MALLFKKNITSDVSLVVWKIEEPIHQMERLLGEQLSTSIRKSLPESKMLQHIASRLTIQHLCNDVELRYDDYGKLHLKSGGGYISVSHTATYAAGVYSPSKAIGVDIEKISAKAVKVQNKFLALHELNALSDKTNAEVLTGYWCAKEAMYKLYGKKEVAFSENLWVKPNNTGLIQMPGFQKDVNLYNEKIGDHCLICAY